MISSRLFVLKIATAIHDLRLLNMSLKNVIRFFFLDTELNMLSSADIVTILIK